MVAAHTNYEGLPVGWRIAQFKEILTRVERKITLDDAATYETVGVRWYGRGAFVRDRLLGMDIKRKQQWIVRAGDVLYNKLFAWKGAFAIAKEAVDGRIVSDKFPTYRVIPELVDAQFLGYYFQTSGIAQQAQDLSKGAAAISKLTLNPPQFWDLTIPLPPLDEQRRNVARIQELAAKVEEARKRHNEANEAADALFASYISAALCEVPAEGRLAGVLVEKPRNGWSARCDNAASGVPLLSLSAVTGFNYRRDRFKRTSEETSPDAHYWLRPGDLLITRSNTPELVGHAAIYDGYPTPCIYPDLMMRLAVDEAKADKEFVHLWLQNGRAREYVRHVAKGTNPSMRKISQGDVMFMPFPVGLTLMEQRHVRDQVNQIKTHLLRLRQLQAGVSDSLEALLPSVLGRAFRGEL